MVVRGELPIPEPNIEDRTITVKGFETPFSGSSLQDFDAAKALQPSQVSPQKRPEHPPVVGYLQVEQLVDFATLQES